MRRDRQGLLLVLLVGLSAAAARPGWAGDEGEKNLTPKAHFMSGKLYFNQKVYDKAEEQFAAAAAGDSTNGEYRSLWATAICELAKSRLDATTKISDRDQKLAAVRSIGSLLKRAAGEFDNAVSLDPKSQADPAETNRRHYWVDLYKAGGAALTDRRFEEAVDLYRLTTVLDPREPVGFFQVAYTYAQLGEIRRGVSLAESSKVMARTRIGELGDCSQFKSIKKKGDCRRQIEDMEKTIRNVDGFTRKFNYDLGNEAFDRSGQETDVTKQLGALDEAIGFYTAALEQDPSLFYARINMGKAWFEKGRLLGEARGAAATSAYQEAGKILLAVADDDSVDADKRRESLFTAAQAQINARDWPKATALLKRYIDLNPRDGEPYASTGQSLYNDNQRLEGVAYYMMSNALSPKAEITPVTQSVNTAKNLYSNAGMGKALAEMGEPSEVRTVVEKEQGGREVTTWIWWSQGKAQHFVKGEAVGQVTFRAILTP